MRRRRGGLCPPTARLHLRQPRPPPPAGSLAPCPRCLRVLAGGGSSLTGRVCWAPGCPRGCCGVCPCPCGPIVAPWQPHEQPCPCGAGAGTHEGHGVQGCGLAVGAMGAGTGCCTPPSSCLHLCRFAAPTLPVALAVSMAACGTADSLSLAHPGHAGTARSQPLGSWRWPDWPLPAHGRRCRLPPDGISRRAGKSLQSRRGSSGAVTGLGTQGRVSLCCWPPCWPQPIATGPGEQLGCGRGLRTGLVLSCSCASGLWEQVG